MSNNKVLSTLLYVQVILFILLPGGAIFGLNVKIFVFFVFFVFLILYLLKTKVSFVFYIVFTSLILFTTFYCLIAFVGAGNAENALIESRLFLVTFSYPMVSCLLLSKKVFKVFDLLKIVVVSHIFYCLIKILIFVLVFVDLIQTNQIVSFVEKVFGVKVMTLEFIPNVTRIQFNLDLLSLIVFPVLLLNEKLGLKYNKIISALFHLSIFLSVLISFSRYIIACYVLIMAIYIILSITSFRSFLLSIVFTGILAFFTYDIVIEVYEIRFSNRISSDSDNVRVVQYDALLSEFLKHPLFGNGFGGYTKEVVRHDDVIFSYELQLLSFLMKFGLFGFSIFSFILLIIAGGLFIVPEFKTKILLLSTYFLWIAANFFNPYIISSMAAVIFIVFTAFPFIQQKKLGELL